ncbi:hypothetical protein NSS79_32630 [Paenibacillus sp. FSL L8-0436]|uniref:hypothetical protein n=1 Tax=Paenibacillus sp. FSL L8-0436 TaxID=2954686 RepID=UPI0031582A36
MVGINHTYSSLASVFPDGRVALFDSQGRKGCEELQFDFMDKLNQTWVRDVKFVLDELEALNGNDSHDRFTGHLDLERLGMFGHSFVCAGYGYFLANNACMPCINSSIPPVISCHSGFKRVQSLLNRKVRSVTESSRCRACLGMDSSG